MTKDSRRLLPRLDRRNAAKNIDYSPSHLLTRSLDLSPPYSDDQTSFRIPDGEVDLLFRNLGISGPEDFAIPAAAWEAARAHHSVSDLLPRSRLSPAAEFLDPPRVSDSGIRGVRPPIIASTEEAETISTLSDPPTVSGAAEVEMVGPSWDLIRSFAPQEQEQEQEVRVRLEEENPDDVTSTSNYGDSPGRAREMIFVISPDAKFKRRIKSWMKGQLLGSGSFGTVYEGISDDGIFFAVKEVSLLDQGNNAQQCILQLEQEITLLSQFEHDNIVQYHGTDKEEAKLFIFIELVTQGSLASLYRKYCLQDSQVSAYTRQILKGLNYLHERNVVHRDIKCANILVHANGSVKLADFGLAKEMSKINMLKSCKGSVYWMAPEVVNPRKTYGPAADIWSLGCTVLEMLTRQIPHPNLEWQHAFFKIGRGEQPPIPSNLSKDARDFITQCVQVNPDDRPSASQLLNHPFVRSRLPYSLRLGSDYSSSPGRDR